MITQIKRTGRKILDSLAPGLLYRYLAARSELEPEISLLPFLCDKAKGSLDIGANWGSYAGVLRHHSQFVIAFEPVPELSSFLRRTFKDKIKVEEVALSNRAGSAVFHLGGNLWGQSSVALDGDNPGGERIDVRLDTLDNINVGAVGFAKIDVEGHEEEVLAGASRTLGRDRPILLVEIEERHRPGALVRIPDLLKQESYRGFYLHDRAIRTMQAFDAEKLQNPAQIRGGQRLGTYINNFLFIPDRGVDRVMAALTAQGFSVTM